MLITATLPRPWTLRRKKTSSILIQVHNVYTNLYHSIATPLAQVEEIAEATAKEIEVLEQKLHDTTDETEKMQIMKDVKRKRGHLMSLIQHLEQTPMDEDPAPTQA